MRVPREMQKAPRPPVAVSYAFLRDGLNGLLTKSPVFDKAATTLLQGPSAPPLPPNENAKSGEWITGK